MESPATTFAQNGLDCMRHRDHGWTLLELVLVLSILSLVIGLLLAAVQKIRASAARTTCLDRTRQLGTALHSHHAAHGRFPPGVCPVRDDHPTPALAWPAHVLPYLDHEPLAATTAAAFAVEKNFQADPPHVGLSTIVPELTCPADPRTHSTQSVGAGRVPRAFTSYLGVAGTRAAWEDGVLFVDSRTRLADIADGTSSTLLAGERPPSADLVFGWWYAGWGQAQDGDGDSVLGVRARNRSPYAPGCPEGPYSFAPGGFADPCSAFHFWSPHAGGANFLFADGSARFLRYEADAILPALATRSGTEPVPGE